MIKAGQIYREIGFPRYVVTLVENSKDFPKMNRVHYICANGESMCGKREKFEYSVKMGEVDKENYPVLIAEYPTWQEAVNSKEFKVGGK